MEIIDFQQAASRKCPDVSIRAPLLGSLVPAWLQDRRTDGKRPRGVKNYEEVFRQFLAFAGNISISQITVDLIKDYKRHMMTQVGAGTTRHRLTVVRSFCAWAILEGYMEKNPALLVPHPRVENPDPDPLTSEEIVQLLETIDQSPRSHPETWRRNRRAVCLMLYAGLRLAERARLHYVEIALSRLEAVQYGTFTPYTLAEERAALEEYRRARYGAPPASDTFLYQIHPIRRRRSA